METITSRTNPLCTPIRKLASSRSYRERQGQFLCDSPKLLEEALAHGGEVRTVIFTERAAPGGLPSQVRQVQVPPDVMGSLSPSQTPQGVLTVCALLERSLPKRGTWCWTASRTRATWARSCGPPTPLARTGCFW